MATKEKKELAGFSQGVRINAALRDMTLAQPICPNSKKQTERLGDGRWVEKAPDPGNTNCQLEGGKWWENCEKRGHNPFYYTKSWYTTEDIIETDAQGRTVKTGEQLFPHEETRLNVTQVAISIRHNSGQGVKNALDKKGYKRLKDMGYPEVCQFRGCQKPINPKARSRRFGDYCSVEHLQLIAADAEGVLLHYPHSTLNGMEHAKIVRARDKQLREATMGAMDA